ncbi:MAG: hypothetical protein HY438_04340 [DPANN group archaeon]|nr:hypothetical protein [DPANN group archaeon]
MVFQLTPKYIFLLLIAAGVVLEVIGDIFIKKWTIESKSILLFIGIAIYLAGSAFWVVSLKYGFLSKAISVFTILNLVLIVLAGVFMFKEDLSLINKIGIGFGIISILLIEA